MTDLFTRTLGAGPPLLLMHAGIATGAQWEPVARMVSASGRMALMPDLRGFGRSPDPAAPYDHVADVLGVLDDAGVDRVVVAGWSMGGGVACALAVQYPARVHALALVNSVPPGFDRAATVIASWHAEEALWEAGDDEGLVRNDLATWVAGDGRTLGDVPPAVVDELTPVLGDLVARARAGADSEGELDATALPSPDDVLALRVPMLALTSEFEHADNAALIERLRGADVDLRRAAVIPGCAHAGPIERPADYARELIAFLDDVGW